MVEEPADQLQGDVFERERRAVEQLEEVVTRLELDERAHVGVGERGVGIGDHRAEVGEIDRVGDEGCHHLGGELGVVVGVCARERRPIGRQVQPTVRRQTSEQRIAEPDLGRSTA